MLSTLMLVSPASTAAASAVDAARAEDVGVELPARLGLDRGADPEEAAARVEVALERGLLRVGEQGGRRRVEEHHRAELLELLRRELVLDLVGVLCELDLELGVRVVLRPVVLADLLDRLDAGLVELGLLVARRHDQHLVLRRLGLLGRRADRGDRRAASVIAATASSASANLLGFIGDTPAAAAWWILLSLCARQAPALGDPTTSFAQDQPIFCDLAQQDEIFSTELRRSMPEICGSGSQVRPFRSGWR